MLHQFWARRFVQVPGYIEQNRARALLGHPWLKLNFHLSRAHETYNFLARVGECNVSVNGVFVPGRLLATNTRTSQPSVEEGIMFADRRLPIKQTTVLPVSHVVIFSTWSCSTLCGPPLGIATGALVTFKSLCLLNHGVDNHENKEVSKRHHRLPGFQSR